MIMSEIDLLENYWESGYMFSDRYQDGEKSLSTLYFKMLAEGAIMADAKGLSSPPAATDTLLFFEKLVNWGAWTAWQMPLSAVLSFH